jgi:hypothetical protein
MLLGQGPERYPFLSLEYQGTLYHLAHLDHHYLTEVPLERLQGNLQFVSCPQGCCLSHFVAKGTLGYLLHRRLTMANRLHPGGLYLEPL